jgi:hypothetical protein
MSFDTVFPFKRRLSRLLSNKTLIVIYEISFGFLYVSSANFEIFYEVK